MTLFRTRFLLSLAVAPLAFASVACSSASSAPTQGGNFEVQASSLPRDTSPSATSADEATLVADNTSFALDLYHATSTSNPSGNLFYSPYSISIALAMTYAGAVGTTEQQMATALGWSNLSASALHPAFDAIDLALASRASAPQAQHGGFALSVADSLWGDQSMTFVKSYLDTLAVSYGSELRVVDFVHEPDPSRVTINQWVSDQTNAKIPQLLGPGTITSDTRFVLANAIYFKAAWQTPFEASATSPQPFTTGAGATVQAQTMAEITSLPYAETDAYQAVDVAYDGAQTSMLVVLPKPGMYATFEPALSGDVVSQITGALSSKSVSLSLPKFTIAGATISLKDELGSLGMPLAFTPGADFSGMVAGSQGQLFLGDVLHQAFVSVDENGTEAAAATAVVGVGLAAPQVDATMSVDRPFFFFIRDIPTGSVLFVGRVTDPTQ